MRQLANKSHGLRPHISVFKMRTKVRPLATKKLSCASLDANTCSRLGYMSRFDDIGLFWEPEHYVKREAKVKQDRQPRTLPPIPETGWHPKAEFPDLSAAKVIGIDTETCDKDLLEKGPGVRRGAYIVGVSVAVDDWARYYPIAHSLGENLDRVPVFAWLKDQLGRKKQPKVGANLLYDLDFLAEEGIEVRGPLYDVQYADPLLDEYRRSYSLNAIAQRLLGAEKETSLLYQWCADAYGGEPDDKQRANIWRAPSELVGPYAEQDARLPIQILRKQWKLLQEKDLIPILDLECRLIPLLLQIRRRGVPVDLQRRQEVDDELCASIEKLQGEVGLNIYVPSEIKALCDAEGIEYPLTELGAPSFTKPWLSAHPHPKLRAVSKLRGFYKLRDTFVRGAMLSSQLNGRIHCEFHPLRSDDYGTVGGRYSSAHPNMQQIPSRDKYWGPRLRSCFVPSEGRVWMKCDLSQIEYRLGVHYGVGDGIDDIRNTYRNDINTNFYKVAAALTGLDYMDSKQLSLGSMYGMGFDKFASMMIDKSREESRDLFTTYHAQIPFIKATYAAVADDARENGGYVRTIGGRLCRLDEGYEHKALNRKLQGSCADWIKRSMLDAYDAGLFDVLELYLTVHDELDSGVPRTPQGCEAARELHHIMTNAYQLCIPVLSSIELGRSWGEVEKFTGNIEERILQ